MKIFIVDIDNTICRTEGEDYENATPYKDRIAKMNKLYDEGNTIIYKTARGQKTGKNWIDFTRKQLNDWGVKYKSLSEKHYADVIVDDKAVNSKEFFRRYKND